MDGWISLHRKLIESEIWEKPPLYIKVWIYLLISAQHTDYKGLKRGQVRTSIPEIIEACKWRIGARVERPTKDQVYQVIEWLRKPNEGVHESNAKATMITTTKATQAMIVTISNYADYQDRATNESNDEGNGEKATKPPRKQRQPNNINNNDNNDNNEQQEKDKELPSPKNPKRIYSEDELYYRLSKRFHELALKNAEEAGTAHLIKEPNYQSWSDTFRLMFEKDKVKETEIGQVVKYALSDSFYRTIIFSPTNLRKHYLAILTKMNTGGGGHGGNKGNNAGPTPANRANERGKTRVREPKPVSREIAQKINSFE